MVRATRISSEGGTTINANNLQFEDLCEVITDKLVAKIPSSYAGKIIKLHHKTDEICQTGQPLLDMEVSDDVKVKEEIKKEEHPAPAPAAEHKPEPKAAPGIIDILLFVQRSIRKKLIKTPKHRLLQLLEPLLRK